MLNTIKTTRVYSSVPIGSRENSKYLELKDGLSALGAKIDAP